MQTLYTIGHSSRTFEDFLDLLKVYHIKQLIDVRSFPQSRFRPWFNKKILSVNLNKHKISYQHLPLLGGRRPTDKHSINTGWENLSFRGFADYMQTKDFYLGLKELSQLMKTISPTVIMCAEALPWRCHRSLISDALVIRRVEVLHILSSTQTKLHEITSFAVIDQSAKPFRVIYPGKNLILKM